MTLHAPAPGPALWPAPYAAGPVHAQVSVPASKSLTNRVLTLAALGDATVQVRNPLRARDSLLMIDALRALGVAITGPDDARNATWTVTPPARFTGDTTIDCGLAGTVMRFVPPMAALADGRVHLDGDPRARERPLAPLLEGLRDLGVPIEGELLPITVHGHGEVSGGEITIDAGASSQFISGLLLAGCRFENGLTVHHRGPAVPSIPHIDMTVESLRASGVPANRLATTSWQVQPAVPCTPNGYDVEPDLSNAAVFLGAALATGGSVTVPGWPTHTAQPGDLLREYLATMGATVTLDEDGLTVTGTGPIGATNFDLSPAGELTPVIVALLALADRPSRISGVAHLRGHETDRLAALAAEINSLGGDLTEHDDGLSISPRPLRGGVFHTYADHRMAHAGALLGLVVPDIVVEDIATTTKTLPDFTTMWADMLNGSAPA
ncbi:MAG TPA: 3-phosphoshikimate 1-carboxyvinyltransferase [Jiangellaceae bacterium]|nr:3-phosphoshikimate 1-carboxyvinyltransferase [Jiangellaceae bacterium]